MQGGETVHLRARRLVEHERRRLEEFLVAVPCGGAVCAQLLRGAARQGHAMTQRGQTWSNVVRRCSTLAGLGTHLRPEHPVRPVKYLRRRALRQRSAVARKPCDARSAARAGNAQRTSRGRVSRRSCGSRSGSAPRPLRRPQHPPPSPRCTPPCRGPCAVVQRCCRTPAARTTPPCSSPIPPARSSGTCLVGGRGAQRVGGSGSETGPDVPERASTACGDAEHPQCP